MIHTAILRGRSDRSTGRSETTKQYIQNQNESSVTPRIMTSTVSAISPHKHRNNQRQRLKPFDSRANLILPLLTVFGLYWFSASFFLAKRSLPFSSVCEEAPSLLRNYLDLSDQDIQRVLFSDPNNGSLNKGCWLGRRIDSLVILVVDALRFDFARYNLPLSIGARIGPDPTAAVPATEDYKDIPKQHRRTTSSQLLQFVADPPTMTMQRLKGLTTGSLPTFADVSGNMGGASIDEDSWVQQLRDTPFSSRGLDRPTRLGFVGDDTWVDLFPRQFDESFPFPSFNTRDLDTVDDGCLAKLPHLLDHLRKPRSRRRWGDEQEYKGEDDLEVIVSHFLGVDHVGHTFGPHNIHMDAKLKQMDAVLSTTLDILDESEEDCHLALIFGDHGMTEEGNHGGGTDDEVNAALFVHFSPACGEMPLDLAPQAGSKYIQDAFQSIHQIDLVPTISILLGLPIPYANLGGIAPSLLGYGGVKETAAALALNAAQVWRYFTVYSETANKLPNLSDLGEQLKEAIDVYKQALARPDADDANAYYKASGLFKVFLVEAAELGHRVWTRFDTLGMFLGGAVLFVTVVFWMFALYFEGGSFSQHLTSFGSFLASSSSLTASKPSQLLEVAMTAVFVFFQCGMLSFSNSYIEAEQSILMYMQATIGLALFVRLNKGRAGGNAKIIPTLPVVIPFLSRLSETFITGHGLDPSIRLHPAHSALAFLPALGVMLCLRIQWFHAVGRRTRFAILHVVVDVLAILSLTLGWLEKRDPDQSKLGFLWLRITIGLLLMSTPLTIFQAVEASIRNLRGKDASSISRAPPQHALSLGLALVSKLLIFMAAVTGPSAASSLVLVSIQAWLLYVLCGATGFYEVSSGVLAFLWKLLIRHSFFATNHGCAFNRLQFSAAFVATMQFNFALSGLQLFLNTFGWEIIGTLAVWLTARLKNKPMIWRWFCFYQILESFLNCISVSILRRHLMAWAIYAPRFLFSSIYLVLNSFGQVLVYFLS